MSVTVVETLRHQRQAMAKANWVIHNLSSGLTKALLGW